MKSVLTNKHISIHTRRRALKSSIEPILMYGCEAWTITKQLQKKMKKTEMGSYGECYESHGLQTNQTKQCYEKLSKQDHS